MDILVKTVRKEGILALYKGSPPFPSHLYYDPSLFSSQRLPTNVFLPKRDGQPPPGYRRRQFAALCCVRRLETHHLAVRTTLVEGDRCGGRDGGSRERRPCEPGGDVQGADAGPVRESVRQTSARRREGDVGRVGVAEGHHARLLGASASVFLLLRVRHKA
jgi:hypothetical protein